MTVQEYIEGNLPFFHITKMNNLDEILANGLCVDRSCSRRGICVVRSDAEDIINEIIDTQLHTMDVPDNTLFALIKIVPQKHQITANLVTKDPVDELAAPLYNYICKDCIKIDEDDIIKRNLRIGEFGGRRTAVVALEGYQLGAPPPCERKRKLETNH